MLREQTRIRPLQRDPLAALVRLREEQGDLATFFLGRQRVIYLSSLELIEEAFVRHAASVGKWGRARRWWLRRPPHFVRGELFNTHDESEHTRARRLFKPALSRARAAQDHGAISTAVDRLLRERAALGSPFDLNELVQILLLGGLLAASFDYELPFDEGQRFVAARIRSKSIESRVFSSRTIDLLDLLRRPRNGVAAVRASDLVTEMHGLWLADRPGNRVTSLPALIGAAQPSDPPKFAESLVVSVSDAPALLLAAWLGIASDPALAEQVRRRLEAEGPEACRGLALEGIRLGAGWLVGRLCQEPFELDGVSIRTGDWLFASPHLLHRDVRYWEDPERIVLDRWEPDEVARRPRRSLLTFGISARICPGRHIVTETVTTTLAVIVRDWDLRLLTDGSSISWRAAATGGDVEASAPIRATVTRRIGAS